MATDKTKLTELGTAVGLFFDLATDPWPDAIRLSTARSAGTALEELLPQLDRELQTPQRGTA